MKAQFVYENIRFERGVEPISSMNVGRVDRRQNKKYLEKISEIVGTDISKEMDRILDILDKDGILITGVDPKYSEDPTSDPMGKSYIWVSWDTGNGREGGEEFAFVQFPNKIPRRWFKKFGKSVWDQNDPYHSGHNAQVIQRIIQEMIWQARTNWPGQKTEWTKDQWNNFRKELSFLKEK